MMSNEQGYNGWTNYETWVTALWIDNEEWSYNERRRIVAELNGEGRAAMADALQAWAEETFIDPITESRASLATDLLRAAWSDVNWFEIAENWMADAS
jgi:hypothetical protein